MGTNNRTSKGKGRGKGKGDDTYDVRENGKIGEKEEWKKKEKNMYGNETDVLQNNHNRRCT